MFWTCNLYSVLLGLKSVLILANLYYVLTTRHLDTATASVHTVTVRRSTHLHHVLQVLHVLPLRVEDLADHVGARLLRGHRGRCSSQHQGATAAASHCRGSAAGGTQLLLLVSRLRLVGTDLRITYTANDDTGSRS